MPEKTEQVKVLEVGKNHGARGIVFEFPDATRKSIKLFANDSNIFFVNNMGSLILLLLLRPYILILYHLSIFMCH